MGIDISKRMLNNAKKNDDKTDFLLMDGCELGFKNETFDYVICPHNVLDFIYPFSNRKKAIVEIRRILKRDGILIYCSHSKIPGKRLLLKNLINSMIFTDYFLREEDYGKLFIYRRNPKKQQKDLEEMGFKTLEIIRGLKNTNDRDYIFYYVAEKV